MNIGAPAIKSAIADSGTMRFNMLPTNFWFVVMRMPPLWKS
jgi:hypothetical protein